MTFKIYTFFPDHLDLNGDQANLVVATKRLEWLGFQVQVQSIGKKQSLPKDADFIFIGHGSIAAWADIAQDMKNSIAWIKSAVDAGAGLMAVASGHEWAINNGLMPGQTSPVERVSKFEIAQVDGLEILGYLNSATNAPVIQKNGVVLGTQLHGPLLAKNPEFADSYLLAIAESRGLSPESKNVPLNNDADLVAGIVKQIWELERDLASE